MKYNFVINFHSAGNPAPIVTWWRSGALLDDTYFRTSQGFVRNELIITELKRSDYMVEFTCQASNTNLTDPVNASVRIDLNSESKLFILCIL